MKLLVALFLFSILTIAKGEIAAVYNQRQSALVEGSEATYLKVIFANGEEEYIRNWECREGVWAEDMHFNRRPTCVCVKGVYAIGSNLCEDDFKIITGDGHCFDIRNKVIRKFMPLLGRRGFDGKANTVFRADGPYFARLNSPTPTTSVPEAMDYLFRMNDPADFSVYSKLGSGAAVRLKCLRGQIVPKDYKTNPIMNIVRLPNCSNEFRGPKNWCNDFTSLIEYQWTLAIGQSWSRTGELGMGDINGGGCVSSGGGKGGNAGGEEKRRDVRDAKVSKKTKRRSKRWAPKQASRVASSSNARPGYTNTDRKLATLSITPLKRQPVLECKFNGSHYVETEFDPSADHFLQPYRSKHTEAKFLSSSYHQKEVNKQNRRIAHHMRKFYLGGEKRLESTPRFTGFDEYKYIQMGKELLKTVCPADQVPHYVVDFFIRAFRFLYIDSSPSYTYPFKSNEHEDKRIEAALTKCKAEAKPITFVGNDSCPDLGIFALNQTLNDSLYVLYNLNDSNAMPGKMAFNISSMDIAIELLWKITMLTHYYCSDQFVDSPFDYSLLFVKMEALLKNPVLMFRWYYPGEFNRLMSFFLMSYDLEKFVQGVDRCVEAAKRSSIYTSWVKRPTEATGWTSFVKELQHSVGQNLNSPTGNFVKGRKKRFYLQDDIWKKQAYCMRSTDAPYTEVRTNTFLSCSRKPVWFDNTD